MFFPIVCVPFSVCLFFCFFKFDNSKKKYMFPCRFFIWAQITLEYIKTFKKIHTIWLPGRFPIRQNKRKGSVIFQQINLPFVSFIKPDSYKIGKMESTKKKKKKTIMWNSYKLAMFFASVNKLLKVNPW